MNFFGENPQFYIGKFVYKKHSTFGPRIQNNLQLIYIYEGEADIFIEGVKHHLHAGRATLLLPGQREYFAFSTRRKTHHGWCESLRPLLDSQVVDLCKKLPFDAPFTKKMAQLASMALPLEGSSLFAEREEKNVLVQAIFWEFLLQAGYSKMDETPVCEPLHKALAHVHAHYADACDLRYLSKVAGVCPAHLIRLFKKHLGCTPAVYLWNARVDCAARLLKESGLGIAEVAFRTGFQNPYHFSRLFAKRRGMSPRVYRKRAWLPDDSNA